MRATIFLVKMLGQLSAQLFKPIGLIAAIRMLQVLGVFGNAVKWGRFITNNFYESIYNSLTGMNFVWLFMRGQTMPVQMSYVSSLYRFKSEWSFNARTQEWVHRDAPYGAPHHYFPFVMTRLTTPTGEYDLTEYFSNQRYYLHDGRKTMPLPAQLMNMWCIETHRWFTADELRNSYFTIMGDDCNDYTIPVILRRPDDVRVYGRLFGIDIPMSDSEESSDVSNEFEGQDSESDGSGSGSDSQESDGSDEEGSDEEGSDEEGSDEEGSDEEGSDEEGSDEEGSQEGSQESDGNSQEGSQQSEGSSQGCSQQSEGSSQEGSRESDGNSQEGGQESESSGSNEKEQLADAGPSTDEINKEGVGEQPNPDAST
jgi:hypothetical protein